MTKRIGADDLCSITLPAAPALSPDGSRLVYVARALDAEADAAVTSLWVVEGDSLARQLTHGRDDNAPVWSPDGAQLAFLRHGQVWLLPAAGGEPRQLTRLPLGAGEVTWSPDSSRLAFTAPVDPQSSSALSAGAPRATEPSSTAPIVIDGLDYQVDGVGVIGGLRRQAFVVEAATGAATQLTDGPGQVGALAFSPDGQTLAFATRPAGATELDAVAAIHTVPASGRISTDQAFRPTLVGFEDGWALTVRYLDDDTLLVVGARPFGGHNGLWKLSLSGGEPVNLAAGLDRNVMPGAPAYPGAVPAVTDDGEVLFAIRDRGCTHLYAVPLAGGAVRPVLAGEGKVVSGLSLAGATAAVALATPTSFGEIVTLDLGSGEQTVRTSHPLPDGTELFARESREFTISDGLTVQGWLMRDPEASGPTPLLVDVHGGPHNAWNGAADEMHLYHQELVAKGWTVLLINPRGSDGYGEEFYAAVIGGWGKADAKDFLEPVDTLVAEGLADPRRLAVAGYSYGSFMACYLTGHDDRFAAAVSGGVVSDLASMGGTSDDSHLLSVHELGLLPWRAGDVERLAELSPITSVDRVRTPTLTLQGTEDRTCPVGQAQQWHTALRERGVTTQLVLYPGGSHIFPLAGRPSHRIDWARRTVAWVERFAGSTTPRPAPIDSAHWQRRLDLLAKATGVPGAQLGILRLTAGAPDELVTLATGILNANTGVSVSTTSLFQIGSISKVWTATVIMQLVDEGKLSLDQTVKSVIGSLELISEELTEGVTIRHLLTHTSGIDGDVFTDTGRGDDTLEKYVDSLKTAAQIHPLGATWSYCNSGYSLLGRVIEVVEGKVWDEVMKERLYTPLGLTATMTLPEEQLLHSVAVGHVEGGESPAVAPVAMLQRSAGPAGLISSHVADVLAFARMHLKGGVAADGARVLSLEATELMTTLQADVPDKYSLGDSWGLGWIRYGWHGARLVGHDGNTIGQAAFLRLLPGTNLAVALLTNGGNTHDLYELLYGELYAELAGVQIQDPIRVPEQPPETDITPYLGEYLNAGARTEILLGEDGPMLRMTAINELVELEGPSVEELALVPVAQGLYAVMPPGFSSYMAATFYSLPTGEQYLHFGGRASRKVG